MALVKCSLVASKWYPGDPDEVDKSLADFATRIRVPQKLKKPPVAGIVPHAGWRLSGVIAHEVWANLAKREPDLVVLFGGHVSPYQRSVIFADEGFETPVGPVMTHTEMVEGLSGAFRFRKHDASMWESDNTTEVHMPMIKRLFPEARIVVLHLPPRDIILDIVELLMEFVRRYEAKPVFVGSTDLTHYGPHYHFTPHGVGEKAHRWSRNENDAAFIQKLVELDPQGCLEEGLSNYNACCPGAAAAAVTSARLMGSEYGELLTQATSYEVMNAEGDPIDFVGYASVLF